jgi:hypothetical protein
VSQLVPINDHEAFKPAGVPFKSVDAARWAHRQRHQNGLAGAFVRIGRNIFIDVPKLLELARKNAE